MPAQKGSSESGGGGLGENDDASSHSHRKQPRHGGMDAGEGEKEERITPVLPSKQKRETSGAVEKADSDLFDSQELLPENTYIDLHEIRKEVQCPICLGIIKRTRTMMECLHRFCRECIDKSMRLGNNECPACRTHCASRRSLRDDPRYDALIAALFPNVEKYEEEELAFHEEDKTRYEQIQASIAQNFQRQSEALGNKCARRGIGGPSASRSRRNSRETPPRRSTRRRRRRTTDLQESDENDDVTTAEAQISFSSGEHLREINQQFHKVSSGVGSSHSVSPATSSDGGFENNAKQKRENRGLYFGLMWNIEMRAWGKSGVRSNTRHGNVNGNNEKNAQSARLTKLVEFLRNLKEDDDKNTASRTPLESERADLLAMKDSSSSHNNHGVPHLLPNMNVKNQLSPEHHLLPSVFDPQNANNQQMLQIMEKETFAGFEANGISHGGQWILAYQQKET